MIHITSVSVYSNIFFFTYSYLPHFPCLHQTDKPILFSAFPSNCVITRNPCFIDHHFFFNFFLSSSSLTYTHMSRTLNFVTILSIPFFKNKLLQQVVCFTTFFLITLQSLYIHCSLASVLITLLKPFLLKLPENLETPTSLRAPFYFYFIDLCGISQCSLFHSF